MSPILYTEEFIKSNTELIEVVTQRLIKAPTPTYSLKRQLTANGSLNNIRIKKINSPTLLMHGKNDIIALPQNSEDLAKLISGAKVVLFDNSAHMIFVEEPEKFVKTLLEFLK
jgi:pimeloyl-ACP methyl ester carboxylesterase